MYNISYFKANNQEDVLEFMKAHPFVVICGIGEDGKPVATHLPIMMVERNDQLFLQAHAMRNQKHTLAFEKNSNVLVIFQSAHSYISAKLYEPQNVASTWNYSAVHASGIVHFLNEDGLYQVLKNLTDHFEGGTESPASFNKLADDYVHEHMRAIIGFEIEVTHLQEVFKLSQNKSEKTKEQIIQQLEKGAATEQQVAADMKKINATIAHKN